MDKAIYTFHHATQWDDEIIGVVAPDLIQALEIVNGEIRNIKPEECINYTLVKDEVQDGIHFHVYIYNPAYEG